MLRVAPRALILTIAAVAVGLGIRAGWAAPLNGPDLGVRDDRNALPAEAAPADIPSPSSVPWPRTNDVAGNVKHLPATAPARQRSWQLEQVARQADRQTRHGFELAGRGAYFAARAEFMGSLRVVAEGLDTEEKTDAHSRALAAGLTAMREAEDFLPDSGQPRGDSDITDTIARHDTPVLKGNEKGITSLAALKRYFNFAQEQLAKAEGREVAGSMALHGLGKLHSALAQKKNALAVAAEPKAMVFYQAALVVEPKNFMAANDLGVLLARGGNGTAGRAMLEYSYSLSRQSITARNLAAAYDRLGQRAQAANIRRQAETLQQAEIARRRAATGTASDVVRWVDPGAFAETSLNTPNSPGATPRPPTRPTRPPVEPGRLSSAGHEVMSGDDNEKVAPTGVAIPAGICHAEPGSVRIASRTPEERHDIVLCQALGPAAPYDICSVDCYASQCCRRGWEAARFAQWQAYAQGEYVGHARLAHVPEYRLRVDDLLDMTYRLTREETATPYRLNVGDTIQVESFTDHDINRELLIQPDGTITLRLLGQVHATGRTVTQLRDALDDLYKKYYKVPAITVTPLKVNTKLEDLRATIDRRAGIGGQSQSARVTPEGTISLPAIGSVQAQCLTLSELQSELNECYRQVVEGIQVIPILTQRAPRYVYVLGEVHTPGRFELTGPTTAMQALSMAGSWNVGANLRQIVVFRRGDDWRLLATTIDLQGALMGNQLCPKGEIWIDDSDVIIVPKSQILVADDFINLVFTRGIYGVFPLSTQLNFVKGSTL